MFGLTNSYIRVPNNDSLNPSNITLAVWIKTSFTDAAWRRIFDKCYGHGYDLTMGGDYKGKSYQGQVAWEVVNDAMSSGVKVADGRWHHLAATFDGVEMRLYVDGQSVGKPHRAKKPPEHTAYDLAIGENRSEPVEEVGPAFNGMMDDVMIFNRALSAEEIRALYDSQKTATDVPLAIPAPQPKNTPAKAAPPAQNKPAAADRLKQVKDLYDQGLINKDEYDKKAKEILDSM